MAGDGGAAAEIFVDGYAYDGLVRLLAGSACGRRSPTSSGSRYGCPTSTGPGRHQDFLLAVVGEGVVGRGCFGLRSGRGQGYQPPALQAGGRRLLVGARPHAVGGRIRPARRSRRGPWRVAARLALGSRLEDAVARELRFDPWNSGGGLVPVGVVNRVRGAAYRGSRRGSSLRRCARELRDL